MAKPYKIECADDWINETHRYRLDVSTTVDNAKRLVVVQINPSKAGKRRADGTIRSDSTIGKVAAWAIANGYGKVTFLNLFAYVATDQKLLNKVSFRTLVGNRNDDFIISSLDKTARIVVAWGRPDRSIDKAVLDRRIAALRSLLGRRRVYAVGKPVAKQFPRHGRLWNSGNRFLRIFKWPTQ